MIPTRRELWSNFFAPIPIDNAMDDHRKEELIVVTIYRNKN